MTLPDELLDRAYAVDEEWGPDRRIERRQRLRDSFKEVPLEELDALLQRLEAVSKTVWEIAEMGGEAKLGRARVIELLQEKHPFLKEDGLRQATFLVNYYAWHEGYDK